MKIRFLFTGTLVSLMLMVVVATALAAPASSAVYRFADASEVLGASASLVRADGNVAMTLRTSELDSGAAYTIWWVVFNNPEDCVAPIPDISNCGEGDIFDGGELIDNGDGTYGTPGVNVSVIFATGHVIGNGGVGNFGANLREGKSSGALFGPGLVDAQGAEIHLVVRTHGQPIPGKVNQQIHTFEGDCDISICYDQQFAVFLP
jgi:hypothetical protein